MRKTTKCFSQDSRCSGRDSNSAPPSLRQTACPSGTETSGSAVIGSSSYEPTFPLAYITLPLLNWKLGTLCLKNWNYTPSPGLSLGTYRRTERTRHTISVCLLQSVLRPAEPVRHDAHEPARCSLHGAAPLRHRRRRRPGKKRNAISSSFVSNAYQLP
jgi:hypothetical protein